MGTSVLLPSSSRKIYTLGTMVPSYNCIRANGMGDRLKLVCARVFLLGHSRLDRMAYFASINVDDHNYSRFFVGSVMSAVQRSISLLEYQALDAASDVKSEYFRGEVFAMAGGTPEHSLVCANFIGESRFALKGRPCVVYTSDLRVKVDATGLYTYPDASIICGELLRDEFVSNTALNPTVIVEVLSESTETYDRGKKSSHYRQIESLQELVLISQDRVSVECYVRKPQGHWLLRESLQLDDSLLLESVGIEIALREIYRGTAFSS